MNEVGKASDIFRTTSEVSPESNAYTYTREQEIEYCKSQYEKLKELSKEELIEIILGRETVRKAIFGF